MAQAFIEHVNITVGSPERTANMLEQLFGWQIRWQGAAADGGHTIHVGTDSHYVAVYASSSSDGERLEHSKGQPLNHIGVEVDDIDAVERRALLLGLTPFSHGNYHPGKRFYLFDDDGIEWEIVNYA
jgi:catechol 2,3-dioxygenase-like lactoylglutathione lyase family enzyme